MKRNTWQAGLALALAGGMLALASAANAQQTPTKVLYKCVDSKGVTSIQAKKCASGSTEVWRRDAQTEPKQTAAEVAAARQREARNQQEVRDLTLEVQRKLDAEQPPEPPSSPREGSHLAGATNPPEGSHRAPIQPPKAPDPTSLNITGCQQAQAFSSAVREKSWLGLNEDQTRRLFAWVADQCRVNTATDD